MPHLRCSRVAIALVALVCWCAGAGPASAQTYGIDPASDATLVYVGTKAQGIQLFRLQTQGQEVFQNVTLVPLGQAIDSPAAAFIEADLTRRLVFAANDLEQFEGKPSGSVSAFAIDRATGKLTLLNQRASLGTRPCRLAADKNHRTLIVANCGSGTVAVLRVAADGQLGEPIAVPRAGKGTNGDGQKGIDAAADGAHPRCVAIDPGNRFAFVCDFDSDQIVSYRFDAENGTLSPVDSTPVSVKAGAGPRHLVFRPDGRFAYVANQRNSTITIFAYDANSGVLTETQSVSTLPEYYDGPNMAGELAMHPGGKYLYVSNRGHNSVVLFAIDPAKGTLTYVEEQGTGGKNPRHFGVEPSARHLAIANQDSDTLLASRIDSGNGRLKPSGVFASTPTPLFVTFVPPPGAAR
jgi:6-phosphogluconolactonase